MLLLNLRKSVICTVSTIFFKLWAKVFKRERVNSFFSLISLKTDIYFRSVTSWKKNLFQRAVNFESSIFWVSM